ncbi:RNA polymerase sigma factor [Polyangium aurulentum]|uniref:RNA polymerase sigma factor n=1 Tax=Polyangium aurulentum TaxID=2567896 RepID=UPI0010ADD4A6|nr:sigma-70 family RNA polymerase sigma factor [Polyangium aurulentum]UQA61835.1 sigma-70 family RNA polymerase sigma factor [Polyangium aurulentum]
MSHPSDPESIRQAILELRPTVAGWMRRWGYDAADADDLAQRSITQALGRVDNYNPSLSAIKTWVYRIAQSVAGKYRKRLDRYGRTFWHGVGRALRVPASGPSPEDVVGSVQVLHFINRILRRMDARYYDVLVARDLHDLSEAETAEALDIPKGTVRSRLERARVQARALLEGHEHELRGLLPLVFAEREPRGALALPVPKPKPSHRLELAVFIPAGLSGAFALGHHLQTERPPLLRIASPDALVLHVDLGAGSSMPPQAPPTSTPAPLGPGSMLGSKPRAFFVEIEQALKRRDEETARVALVRYLAIYPADPLRLRQPYGWLLRK